GRDPAALGPPRHGIVTLPPIEPRADEHGFVGEVIFRDTFGNLITNMPAEQIAAGRPADWSIEIAGTRVAGLCRTYSDRSPGTLVALTNSSGWIEIAVRSEERRVG